MVAGYAISSLGFGFARPGFTAGSSIAVDMSEQARVAGAIAAVNGINVIFAPLLMVHYPLQHRIFDVRASAWEMGSKPGYTTPFSVSYIPENLEHALKFLFDEAKITGQVKIGRRSRNQTKPTSNATGRRKMTDS